jgi:hypothetical protein
VVVGRGGAGRGGGVSEYEGRVQHPLQQQCAGNEGHWKGCGIGVAGVKPG